MAASQAKAGLCKIVGNGGVGESGATSLVTYEVTGAVEIVMVLRNVSTSLCPNTGAIAVLTVNGVSVAHGAVTALHSSIQANAKPGDKIAALVHAIPLFNGVVCVRLGELQFTIEQCNFE